MLDTLGTAWDTAVTGDQITRDQRVAIRVAAANAMRAGIEVVDTTFRLAGGSALYDANPALAEHILAAIQFVLGDLEADTTPSAKLAANK